MGHTASAAGAPEHGEPCRSNDATPAVTSKSGSRLTNRSRPNGLSESTSSHIWVRFFLDCLLGGLARFAFAWSTPGFGFDKRIFESWAATMQSHPLSDFYATALAPDHLPGDLWILKITTGFYGLFGGHAVHSHLFGVLLRLVPMGGDFLVALALLLLVRDQCGDQTATRSVRWYLFNPATILLTGIFGQWDSVSLGLLLIGLWLLTRPRWWVLSAAPFAWAILVKPQLALPALAFAVLVLPDTIRRGPVRGPSHTLTKLTAWVILGCSTAYVLVTPFRVHLVRAPNGGYTLIDRLRYAADMWPYRTMGAANFWSLVDGSRRNVLDSEPWLYGHSAASWGMAGLCLLLGWVIATYLLRLRASRVLTAALWVNSAALLSAYLVATRSHERYAYSALILLLALVATAGFPRRLVGVYWLLSAAFCLNLSLVFKVPQTGNIAWVTAALAYCGVTIYLLTWPWLRQSYAGRAIRHSSYAKSMPPVAQQASDLHS